MQVNTLRLVLVAIVATSSAVDFCLNKLNNFRLMKLDDVTLVAPPQNALDHFDMQARIKNLLIIIMNKFVE